MYSIRSFKLTYYLGVSPRDPDDEYLSTEYRKFLKNAEKEGIVVVSAAGNHAKTVILARPSALYTLTI